VELDEKHNLIQQVNVVTHSIEIFDFVFTNENDLISDVSAHSPEQFTDHKVLTATLTYSTEEDETEQEEDHLLEVGKRLGNLDFNKAPWEEIKAEL
jgi:hypothetical protein